MTLTLSSLHFLHRDSEFGGNIAVCEGAPTVQGSSVLCRGGLAESAWVVAIFMCTALGGWPVQVKGYIEL